MSETAREPCCSEAPSVPGAPDQELVAPLVRVLGSFDLAEDVVQDAFGEALRRWAAEGAPDNPTAWLRQVARNRAIDQYRRRRSFQEKEAAIALEVDREAELQLDEEPLDDDVLRLVFTCCHPSLAPEVQVALTLRVVCGLTSEQVARAFLLKHTTLQQRLVRAKKKIAQANIPYRIPDRDELPGRVGVVLRTIYLVFNEGYGSRDGEVLTRSELCDEAIRLGRLSVQLLPRVAGPRGLLALMLLHHSRRGARVDSQGDLVVLEEQDRRRWDRGLIDEALPLVEDALRERPLSNYALEAAIAAIHAQAADAADTDWRQIAALYDVLLELTHRSPVVALNAAVAVAMAGDLETGLARLNQLERSEALPGYHLLPAAQADLWRRAGRPEEAKRFYEEALRCVTNPVERRFLEKRLASLGSTAV